jgi:hypothetical protein
MRCKIFYAFLALLFFSSTGRAETLYDKAYQFFLTAKPMDASEVKTDPVTLEGTSATNRIPNQVTHRQDTFRREDDPVLGGVVYFGKKSLTKLSNGELGFVGPPLTGNAILYLRKQVSAGKTYWVVYYQYSEAGSDDPDYIGPDIVNRQVIYYLVP